MAPMHLERVLKKIKSATIEATSAAPYPPPPVPYPVPIYTSG